MNLITYQQEVKRTCADLGSKLLNSIHMTLGLGGELLEELTEAIEKRDLVNISEELGDAQWFACNYATLHNISLPGNFMLPAPERITVKDRTRFYSDLKKAIGKLQDFDKKELAYGKKPDEAQRSIALYTLLFCTEFIALEHTIDMEVARQKIVDKLRVRFPEKFDADKAINRDTVTERQILEQV
jgi:NTP pyrophosphatase (non-canonical NTP hydrolase)